MSCSSSQEAVSFSYEKIDEKRQDAYTEVWTYKYSVANGPWEEIKVYLRGGPKTYIIFVVTDPAMVLSNWGGRTDNKYFYDYMKHPPEPNFVSQTRATQGSVRSLEEAVETALSWFIEDNKTRK